MKIRWTPGSVRFRITPEELAALENSQPVSAALTLGENAAWSACIAPGAQTVSILRFESGVLQVHLSPQDLLTLGAPENEGVYLRQNDLRFYIEKDFPCAHPRAGEAEEAASETFAPPPGFEERKDS